MTAQYKPSEIVLGVPPLVGTMGRAVAEHAAALMVRACVRNGDRWQEMTPPMVGEAMKADADEKIEPTCSLVENPFFRPNMHALVDAGYAEWVDEERGPLRFTDKAIEAMRRWVPVAS